MNAPLRWSDRRTPPAGAHPAFTDAAVLVCCPACGSRATITTMTRVPGKASRGWRVTCSHCSFAADSVTRWWGELVNSCSGRCARCGRNISRWLHGTRPVPRMSVRCKECDHVTSLRGSTWLRSDGEYYAGLRLWLTSEVAGHTLWAYNAGHLSEIEAYVQAALRERTPNRNGSFASQLPAWTKSAKHRTAVLKACQRMRATL